MDAYTPQPNVRWNKRSVTIFVRIPYECIVIGGLLLVIKIFVYREEFDFRTITENAKKGLQTAFWITFGKLVWRLCKHVRSEI